MNRLTKRAKNGLAYSDIPLNQSSVLDANENIIECYTGFIAERLAAYEDTGLEPKEIKNLIKEYNTDSTRAAHYEHLEEQGLLFKLPCKVGDTVYVFFTKFDRGETPNVIKIIKELTVVKFGIVPTVEYATLKDEDGQLYNISLEQFGDTAFTTREEAEKALEVTE